MQCSIREKEKDKEGNKVKIVIQEKGKQAVKVPKKYIA